MEKYWFKVRLTDCSSSARIQVVVWADTLEEATAEILRAYGDSNPVNFEP